MKYLNIATNFSEKFINEFINVKSSTNPDSYPHLDPRRNLDKFNLAKKSDAVFISSDLVDKGYKGAIFIMLSTLSIGLLIGACYGLKKYIENEYRQESNFNNNQTIRLVNQNNSPSFFTSSPVILNNSNLTHDRV
jgi:hypothetical protein